MFTDLSNMFTKSCYALINFCYVVINSVYAFINMISSECIIIMHHHNAKFGKRRFSVLQLSTFIGSTNLRSQLHKENIWKFKLPGYAVRIRAMVRLWLRLDLRLTVKFSSRVMANFIVMEGQL